LVVAGVKPDHLAALFLSPMAEGSRGVYTPDGFDLHLRGGEGLADRLVHHHEAQHVLLTMSTAWGAALLLVARMPAWAQLFDQLLDRCRTTHESFATYLSCIAVTVGLGSPAAALALYPEYVPLADRLDRYLAVVPGEQRRGLAVTALTRVCMQTPILEQLTAAWPVAIKAGSIRGIDVPDERLNHLLRDPDRFPGALVTAADDAVAAEFGPEPLAAARAGGGGGGGVELDDRFDAAWARWEDTVFDAFAARLAEVGATVIGSNDHVPVAAELVALARSVVPELGVNVDPDPDVSDRRVFAYVLRQARLWLAALRRPARMITAREDVELPEVVRVADATTRVGGRPNLVLSARLPARLSAGYDLPEDDRAVLAGLNDPVVVIRTIADDGTDTETDAVWLVRLGEPADVAELTTAWDGRGDLTCCVAASCLTDAQWRTDWLPVLDQVAPIVWLMDVAIESLTDEFGSGRTVHGIYLDLGPTPTGARRAVAFKASGMIGVWLAVADEVGIELITQQVAELPGIDLRMTGRDWTDLVPTLRLVLLDLLRTESYVDLRALSDRRN
jgi:hypothetical protein